MRLMTPTGRLASVGARLVPTTPSSKFAVFVAVAITATFAFVFEAPPELVATVLVLGILTARGFNSASGIPTCYLWLQAAWPRKPVDRSRPVENREAAICQRCAQIKLLIGMGKDLYAGTSEDQGPASRDVLTEAVRNTQPEPKRPPKANKDS
jgi:hypothetical protein